MAGKSKKLPGLRGVIEREGISLRELHRRTNVSLNNLSRLASLQQGAYTRTIYRIAEGLHCTVPELERPVDQSGDWTPAERGEMLPEADVLASRARALPDELLVYLHSHVVRELAERGLPRYDVVTDEAAHIEELAPVSRS